MVSGFSRDLQWSQEKIKTMLMQNLGGQTKSIMVFSELAYFTVVCLVAWPMNESEARLDLVLIETSLLFLFKFLLIGKRTDSTLTQEKPGSFYQNKVNSNLTFMKGLATKQTIIKL